jgi:hypothetical protein
MLGYKMLLFALMGEMRMLRRIGAEIAVICVIATVLACVLMPAPITGVADNGDFERIMNSTGLSHIPTDPSDRYFGYVNREYAIIGGTLFDGGYISSEIPLVLAAIGISRLFSTPGIFDIRVLSLFYSLIFIFAFFLVIRSIKRMSAAAFVPVSIILLFVFTDIGYLAYFNSFYGEAVSLVFLMLMMGGALYCISDAVTGEKPKLWALTVFFIGLAFFVSAKVQNIPSGLLALVFGLRLMALRRDRIWRRTAIISIVFVLAASLLTFTSVSKDIKICNKYQSVFYGILKDSPDPSSDLAELGLNPAYSSLAGTNYFMDSYPVDIRSAEFKDEIFKKVTYAKVAGFYLKHPDRFLSKLDTAASNAFMIRPGMGNFEKSAGKGYGATADYLDAWSDLKDGLFPHKLSFILRFFSIFILLLCIEYIRAVGSSSRRGTNKSGKYALSGSMLMVELVAALFLIAVSQLAVPILGDGEADISKHLFLFNTTFDLLFTALAVYAVHCLIRAVLYLKMCYNGRKRWLA